jgi:transposase
MVKALIAGNSTPEVLVLASKRFKASREELFDALEGELTPSHCFVLDELMQHIEEIIETRIARFDSTWWREWQSNPAQWRCYKPCPAWT